MCRVVERVAFEESVFVELPAGAHLCLGSINTKCDDREKGVNNPYPKIFAGRCDKFDGVALQLPSRRCFSQRSGMKKYIVGCSSARRLPVPYFFHIEGKKH
jgi:hypothetical protein